MTRVIRNTELNRGSLKVNGVKFEVSRGFVVGRKVGG